ncbi:MAG: ABC transporter ATP-binding protein [Candidatus Heimdallarchaeota archaeon]|nr:ABC transporter ATP-binding protein [Candidatus Heimdallarchaeota archaeon]
MEFIEVQNLVKIYENEEFNLKISALKGINLKVKQGELIGIIGSSGAGKTTLLSIIGGLLEPTYGTVFVENKDISKFTKLDLLNYRRETVSFLWQLPEDNLIKNVTLLRNVMIPLQITNKPLEFQKKTANEMLDKLGLSHRKNHKPNQISGGEAQRAGLAVALANNPKILLGDQITGELDTTTSVEVVNHLKEMKDELGTTMIIATHKKSFTKITDRNYEIKDGLISHIISSDDPNKIEELLKEEYLIIDENGKVCLPKEILEQLKTNHLLKVEIENGIIKLIPIQEDKTKEKIKKK